MICRVPRNITSWRQFAKKVRRKPGKLLAGLAELENTILISGCQRSGTTILSHIFLEHKDIIDFRRSSDSELDGALILSGLRTPPDPSGRYCFQATYLNQNFYEYFEFPGKFKLIFVIRNPYSVVYSMCYHWGRRLRFTNFALNELFASCGMNGLTGFERMRIKTLSVYGISPLRKACLAYAGKTAQIFELYRRLGKDMLVIDYDDLVREKENLLPVLFAFVNLPYEKNCAELIKSESLDKADKLSQRAKEQIRLTCLDVYKRAGKLALKASVRHIVE